jgi:hypothetical protein
MSGENRNLAQSIQQFCSLLNDRGGSRPNFRHLHIYTPPKYDQKRKTLLWAGFCKVITPGN